MKPQINERLQFLWYLSCSLRVLAWTFSVWSVWSMVNSSWFGIGRDRPTRIGLEPRPPPARERGGTGSVGPV